MRSEEWLRQRIQERSRAKDAANSTNQELRRVTEENRQADEILARIERDAHELQDLTRKHPNSLGRGIGVRVARIVGAAQAARSRVKPFLPKRGRG